MVNHQYTHKTERIEVTSDEAKKNGNVENNVQRMVKNFPVTFFLGNICMYNVQCTVHTDIYCYYQ